MDEDVIFQPQAQKNDDSDDNKTSDVKDVDSDVSQTEKVFDITPDLNIAPINDEPNATVPPPDPGTIYSNAQLKDSLAKSLNITVPPVKLVEPANNLQSTISSILPERFQEKKSPSTKTPPTIPANLPVDSSADQTKNTDVSTTPVASEKPKPPVNQPITQFSTSIINKNPTEKPAATNPNPTVTQTPKYTDPNIKPLRTYESDFAEAMSHNKVSTASIAIAEKKRQNAAKEALRVQNTTTIKEHEAIDETRKPEMRMKMDGTQKIEVHTAIDEPKPIKTPPPVIVPPEPAPFDVQPAIFPSDNHSTRKIVISLLSFVLIVGGLMAAFYLYSISPIAPVAVQPKQNTAQALKSLIPADTQFSITIDNLFPSAIISRIKTEMNKQQKEGSIKEIIFVKNENGKTVRVTSPQMTKIMDITAPNILLRSLDSQWMLGIYTDDTGKKSVFVAITDNFFQNAFAGMLQWEDTMAEDFRPFLNIPTYVENATIASTAISTTASTTASKTTATSTPKTPSSKSTASSTLITNSKTNFVSTSTATSIIALPSNETPYYSLRGQFVDRIIKNKDVREFITANNKILFLYSFIDNGTIIISENETTLSEIVGRLEKQSFIR